MTLPSRRATDHPDAPAMSALALVALLGSTLAMLAMARPIDHDESQYVAAAVLAWGKLPYRDFAYLQTPLQPLVFAPIAAMAGTLVYPVLRLVNALLGAGTVVAIYAAACAGGVSQRIALASAGLFASCDIFLFSISVARNDALPAAMLAIACWLIMRAENGKANTVSAALIGALLAGAAAAKISYAIPAAAYGLYALADRTHRPVTVALGAAPIVALVGWLWALVPGAFWFEVITFPARAPVDWYAGGARAFKLTLAAKFGDTLKFLALGPALLAVWAAMRGGLRGHATRVLDILIIAGLIAALLPTPTWRQYLLPLLPALFIRLGLVWQARPPGSGQRVTAIVLACAGIAPSVEALIGASRHGLPVVQAAHESAAIAAALNAARITGPVATLSPQFVPATGRPIDPRFATGPFFYRSRSLLPAAQARRWQMVSQDQSLPVTPPPAALLIGGEDRWTSGSAAIEAALLRHPPFDRWRRLPVASDRFRLYAPPAGEP
ncbi:DUF2029 domain-containing protein [Sphingomonas sp. 28-62-11]|uniref:DUF2029 domain-containing protein n=1 Tax=Sphingomonas sp. 28-62-11 TaxID=1970432 RepID=UPI0035A90721